MIREYGLRMPAGRIVVNSPSPQGSIGATTNLFPAMTLGCGAPGGNITSDNISPMHLINLRRVAYEVRPVTRRAADLGGPVAAAGGRANEDGACTHQPSRDAREGVSVTPTFGDALTGVSTDERIAVARAIERFLAQKAAQQQSAPIPPKPKEGLGGAPKAEPLQATSLPKRPVDFVSEAEVRAAVKRNEKILVGRKTIITPAARDLAAQHDIFVKAD